MAVGMTNHKYELEKSLKEKYLEGLKREDLYWKDKSRELWIAEGDANAIFFHASVKVKRLFNKISIIKNDGDRWCVSSEDIEQATIEHFVDVLGKDASLDSINFPLVEDSITNLVSGEDNNMLLTPFSIEEVKEATFSIHPHKSPDPDGIMTEVFQACWDFMRSNIWMVLEFKKRRKFIKAINHMMIALIPKK
ncbi:uncharacterized protein LOC131872353 [Cryptomeria japonica]|uniref:uncharacterized protein LOC131872353 n=1 Tax=Cryptomeria japonica TaxID=3369 RepID=UPI0027DA1E70|nr:uncharacterized protein LOC131872353 [Cryptomeria japonica]